VKTIPVASAAIAAVLAIGMATGALAQEPMFPGQYPLVPQRLSRTTLEELTSYPASAVAPLDRPDATKPELFKQLPFNERFQGETVKLTFEPGGSVAVHEGRFREIAVRNSKVEVINDCASACTLVVSHIKKENLCFGPNASLKFHQARHAHTGQLSPDTTERMYRSYPDDIRAWIDRKGGPSKIPHTGWLYLDAPELWKMGYAKCSPG
jgi:hypothetical protein